MQPTYAYSAALLLVAALASLPTLAADPTATPVVDARQQRQEQRIEQGRQAGQLTPREAARLERGQTRVQNREADAKADGTVTRQERARLQHAENRQSRHIARQKHDAQGARHRP